MDDTQSQRRIHPALLWCLAIVPLLGFWLYGLFDVDEGFYAGVVAEMLWRGDWITPHFNGSSWFEKPILTYWLAAPAIAIFGESLGPRAASVLCTIGTYAVVAAYARRYLGEFASQVCMLVLASSLLFVGVGRMLLADPPFILSFSLAMLTFYRSLVDSHRWRILTAAMLGVSALAKGPVGLIIFAVVAITTFIREPELRPSFRGSWLLGFIAFGAVAASWYLPAYLANGDRFVQEFFVQQNIGRFRGGDAAHTLGGPLNWFLYLPILLVGMLPWSLWVPKAWPLRKRSDNSFLRYAGVWAIAVLAFFSISGAKLPHYITPIFPPLAMIVGAYLTKREIRAAWLAATCVIVCLVTNAGFLVYYRLFHEEVHALARFVRQSGGSAAVYQMTRRDKDLGTGKLKIQETSHPSLVFYLRSTVVDTDDFAKLLSAPKPLWVITRANRMERGDYVAAGNAGQTLEEIDTGRTPVYYRLFRLTMN